MKAPTADDARAIAANALGEEIISVARFTTGAGNWVYDVTPAKHDPVVVRFCRHANECAGGVQLNEFLRPKRIPLPELIAHHLPDATDDRAWMILHRFPGNDLGHVYPKLTRLQLIAILNQVMHAQKIVQQLPQSTRFGFSEGLNPPAHDNWADVLNESLDISQKRIKEVGAVSTSIVDRVRGAVAQFDFAEVRPIPFLDDTTTRNVIVHNDIFEGIVDVDGLCYGDPLFVVALTRNALLARGWDTVYTDTWTSRLDLPTIRRQHLDLYTAIFAVNFISEQGQQFNLESPPPINRDAIVQLQAIVELMLSRL